MTVAEMKKVLISNGYEFELYKETVSIYAPNETEASWDIPFGWRDMGFDEILKTDDAARVIGAAYKSMVGKQ